MRSFIVGTDWGEDCDDAVALRVLTRAALRKEIELLAVGINTRTQYSAPSAYAFLEKEGCVVPIGVDKSCPKTDWINRYQPRLAACTQKKDEDFEDAVRVYRRALVEAQGRVEIIEIGFLQILSGLLESEGDDISPLSGKELVKSKVDKVWIMGGKWSEEGGLEFNFSYTPFARVAAHTVCELCPCPITFLGFEVGVSVRTGDTLSKTDYLYQTLVDWGCEARPSWDPMLCLLALIGDEEKAGYRAVRGRARVDRETGRNYFTPDTNGSHAFVVKSFEDKYYKNAINERIE